MGDTGFTLCTPDSIITSDSQQDAREGTQERLNFMLGSTITLAVNAVNKVLVRVNDSEPYQSSYFLEDGDHDITLTIKHQIPSLRAAGKESHLVRLDVVSYDAEGVVIRKQSTWTVLETALGRQDSTNLGYYFAALATWASTNKALILARDS